MILLKSKFIFYNFVSIHKKIQPEKSIFHLVFKILMTAAYILNHLSEKLYLHDYSYHIFFSSILLAPILFFSGKVSTYFNLISIENTLNLLNGHREDSLNTRSIPLFHPANKKEVQKTTAYYE